MVKPAYMIAIAAVLLAASFAGVVLIDDEADAADAEEAFIITYQGEKGVVTQEVGADGTVTLYGASDVGAILDIADADVYELDGWSTEGDNPVVYEIGAKIKPTADLTLVPVIDVKDDAEVMFFEVGDETFIVKPTGDSPDYTITIPEEVLDAIAALEEEGYIMNGWMLDDTDYVDVSGEYPYQKQATVTADIEQVFDISFVVDGTVTDTQKSTKVTLPTDPVKENYTFVGWAVDGKVITVVKEGEIILPEDYAFTADTTLTAVFEPVNKTVTLMDGVTVIGKVTVLYNEKLVKPDIEDGYYWAVQTKAPAYGEDGTTIVEEAEYSEFDFSTPITGDMTLYAIAGDLPTPDEKVYVTFNIEGKEPYTYIVSDRLTVPSTDREGYNFLGWTIEGQDVAMMSTEKVQSDIRAGVYTEDTTFVAVYEVAEPPAPEGPAFYETNAGMIAIFLVIVVIAAFIYAYMTNTYGLKDKLSFKIVRNGGDKKE